MKRGFLAIAFAVLGAPLGAQVMSFDTKRCDNGDYRRLGDAYAAFCSGYRDGTQACQARPLERKEVSDACLAGASVHSQSRIRNYVDAPIPTRAAAARSEPVAAPRPSAEVCRKNMLDQIGLARVDEVREAIAPRFQEIVVGTIPESWNMRLDARRSGCDDARVSAVLYDFDAAGILREVTYVWVRPAGAAPHPVFKERAAALGKQYRASSPPTSSRLEGNSAKSSVVLQDIADRNVVLETYALPK